MNRPRVYILASNGREAALIASAAGLRPRDWALYTELGGRGLVGATLWETQCWAHARPPRYVHNVRANIRIGRMLVERVPCPPEP